MSSTKKQKMMMSRSIVDKIRKELNPPGRFLEKNSDGVWSEVPTKKALEKTAQALRDGAFPLKKEMQLSEDFSDTAFLSAIFNEHDGDALLESNANSPEAKPASHPLKQRGHRRQVSAPVIQQVVLPELDDLPDPKRCKPNNLPSDRSYSLTGVNFPSPGVDKDNIEFLIGANGDGSTSSTKKHHRRNRTFGGYSCSDKNVSEMHIDEIFALFVGNSGKTNNQHQQEFAGMNEMPLTSSFNQGQTYENQHHLQNTEGVGSNQLNTNMNSIGHHQRQQSAENINIFCQGQHQQNESAGDMNATLNQLFSNLNQQPFMNSASNSNINTFNLNQSQGNQNAQLLSSMVSNQQHFNLNSSSNNDMMQYSPHTSPSLEMQPNHQLPELNLMTTVPYKQAAHCSDLQAINTLSGAKQHRRYNTIATGQCFMGHQTSNAASASAASSQKTYDFTHYNMSPNEQSFNLNSSSNNDMMQYSPHKSPSLEMQPIQGQKLQPNHQLPELNLMTTISNKQSAHSSEVKTTNTLSGNKRHRRYNTIANGHCFMGHQMSNAASAPAAVSNNLEEFNLDFLNNVNPEPNSNASNNTQLIGIAQNSFNDFSDTESYELPLKDPAPPRGRHRRVNTTGNIGLPQDFNFSLDQPSMLNTIDEEVSHFHLPNDGGSLMSSKDNGSDSKPSHQKVPSISSIVASIPSTVNGHTRDTSSKSSLSNEDFCIHLMAAGNWEGMNDVENDGLTFSDT